MKKILQRLAFSALIVCTLTASDCDDTGQSVPAISAEVLIDESQNGGEVFLLRGQLLVLSLASNPTTGFTWEVEQIDTSVLRQVGLPQFQPSSDAAGAGGIQTFRFDSVSRGETDLKLIYHRPFEEGQEPQDRYEVHVIVL